MRMSTLSLIATCIFVCIATVAYYNTQSEAFVTAIKRQYRTYMQAACESAMDSVGTAGFAGMSVFGNKADRQTAVVTFFKTLAINFNRDGVYTDELLKYVPVIMLVDYDGFYVWHGGQIPYGQSITVLSGTGDIMEYVSWSENVGKYVVRYYLNSTVKVTDTEKGKVYYGTGEEVYNLTGDTLLKFLAEDEECVVRKNNVIVSAIKKAAEYYINSSKANEMNVGYNIELAKLDGEDWGRLLKTPTILAFLQGKQLKEIHSDIVLNIYSFSGTEITGTYHYFIDESNHYHCLEEFMDNEKVINIGGKYYYDGIVIDKIYNSMEECARLGAYPGFDNN